MSGVELKNDNDPYTGTEYQHDFGPKHGLPFGVKVIKDDKSKGYRDYVDKYHLWNSTTDGRNVDEWAYTDESLVAAKIFKVSDNSSVDKKTLKRINKLIINESTKNDFYNMNEKHSFDKKDFNYSFIRGLNFEDAVATLTYYTAKIISDFLNEYNDIKKIVLCGGGRKNKTLIKHMENLTSKEIVNINDFGVDGDYIESQAFAYLGIRSFLKKKISFPQTTKVSQSITGGVLVKNY